MSEGIEKAVAKIPKVSSSLTSEIKEALNRISSSMEENFATIETKLDSLSTELQEVKSQLVNRGSNQPTIVVTGGGYRRGGPSGGFRRGGNGQAPFRGMPRF